MRTLTSKLRDARGFTLIELLVVILIIGLLAALVLPNMLGNRDGAKDGRAKTAVRLAIGTADTFYNKNETYTGFQTAVSGKLNGESSLGATPWVASTLTERVGADDADEKNIYVSVGGTGGSEVIVCSNSPGQYMFCIRKDQSNGDTKWKKFDRTTAAPHSTVSTPTGAAVADHAALAALIDDEKF